MARRIAQITLDNLGDLPVRCRGCVFWELGPIGADQARKAGTSELEKEAWVSGVLLEWGSCGRVAYIDDLPAGYVTYATPALVPRSSAFPTSPVSADAAMLTAAHVLPDFAGGGLGRVLVQHVAKDLIRRGVRAVEAFGDMHWDGPACILPVDFLLSVGFKTVRPHHRFPRLRLELKNAISWREDVEVALERLLGSLPARERALRPI